MPETTYTRNVSVVTAGYVNVIALRNAIDADGAITPTVVGLPLVTVESDVVKVKVTLSDAMTAGEETAFDALLVAHDPTAVIQTWIDSQYPVQEEHTLAAGAEVAITHSADVDPKPHRRVDVWKQQLQLDTNLASSLTHVDVAWSTTEVNLNDGSQNSFCFNNSQTNPAGKYFELDAGAGNDVTATHARWFDYPNGAYGPAHYKIQGSNDGTNWDDLADISSAIPHRPAGSDGHVVDLGGSQTYRYWRWHCVTGKNAAYVIINELELYFVTGTAPWVPATEDVVIKSDSATQTTVCNKSGQANTFLITVMIPS